MLSRKNIACAIVLTQWSNWRKIILPTKFAGIGIPIEAKMESTCYDYGRNLSRFKVFIRLINVTSSLAKSPSESSGQISVRGYAQDPDVQLMLRVKEDDQDAFAQLVENYQNRLIAIFWHMLRNRDVAEDLTQETFMRVYRARQTYNPTAKFSTWLFRIANNLASNTRRSKGRRKEVQMYVQDSQSMTSRPAENLAPEKSALMPTRQLASKELQDVVQVALSELNERQRMALLLHKFEGFNYSEIGESLELTTAAVKSLLSRARESLKYKLERYVK